MGKDKVPLSYDRVERAHAEARAAYDRMSRWYDLLSGGAEWGCIEDGLRRLDPATGERLLEIGYGTGRSLEWIARHTGGRARLMGVDLSPAMRKVAARRLARAAISGIGLDTGDACSLPYSAESFDGVFSAFTLELFDTPEIPTVLSECRRVLKPGGRLVVVSLALPPAPTAAVELYRWVHRRLPRLVDCRPIPTRALVEGASFVVREHAIRRVWGLPVDILRAVRE